MEGLMLAQLLRKLAPALPARHMGWAFPDETTAALLLEGIVLEVSEGSGQGTGSATESATGSSAGNLVLTYRPPQSVVYLTSDRLRGEPRNPFQRFLHNRVRGQVLRVEQLKLDRVFALHFGPSEGFVHQPAARLIFEVTGRNANVLVLEAGEGFAGKITLAAREITGNRNRFRTVRSGGLYTPPPPYEKFDPRQMTEAEARELADVPLHKWMGKIDGLGPLLSAELARRAGLEPRQAPKERWTEAFGALKSLVDDPSVSEGILSSGAKTAARTERVGQLRKMLREPLQKRLTQLSHQLDDVKRAEQALERVQQERQEADLLMAYAHSVPTGAAQVSLPLFDGSGEQRLELEPQLSARQNAEKRYKRARRREEVYLRLAEREDKLRHNWEQLKQQLEHLEDASLRELESEWEKITTAWKSEQANKHYGWQRRTPAGHTVLIGRNNKENALLTHRIARSMDWWFHAQGYPGSHVIVRSGGRTLDLPDILYVAQLAAFHSKARGSGNVAVDYTRIKHVWRPRGAAAGQVHYTDQKTVFVDGLEEPQQPDT